MSKIGRNDPCPCGSGKKYKQCCARSDAAVARPAPVQQIFQLALEQHRGGRLQQAQQLYRQVLQAQPRHADALNLSGVIAGQTGQYDEAVDLLRRAIAIDPANLGYYGNLGLALQAQGQFDAAIDNYRKMLALRPDQPEVHNSLGHALQARGEFDAARSSFERALALKPDFAEAHYNLGKLFEALSQSDAAIAAYEAALALRPDYAEAINNLGFALQQQGRLEAAAEHYRRAFSLGLGNSEAYSNYLLIRHYDPAYTQAELLADHRAFAARFEAPLRAHWPRHAHARLSGRRLKIGFVSGDLHQHPVGFFLENVLAHLDRERFDITLYANNPHTDALTGRLRAMDVAWVALHALADDAAAQRVRADGIDILVDLSGHTAQNRLLLFARKPAPVQVAWLGYWCTTGLSAMDYLLCDERGIPADEAGFFVEKPWYLPDTRLCFTPPTDAIEPGELPALQAGHITFGCFNNLIKVNDAVVELWARILRDVADSRLLLKTKQFDDERMRRDTHARFARHGIAPQRLVLEGYSSRADYLAAYRRIDIALDPFPFTGATTSVEGLWMGVPLVTRRGDRLVARQGESILHNVGLQDWIGADDSAYVDIAHARAADLQQLARLRADLRERLLASPLCDAPRFARNLEKAFEQMWRLYCASA